MKKRTKIYIGLLFVVFIVMPIGFMMVQGIIEKNVYDRIPDNLKNRG